MFSFDFDEILDFAIPISLSLFLVVKNVQFFNFLLLVLVGGKTYQVGRVYASGTTTSLHLASFNLQHNKAAHKQINHSNESFLAIILVSFWHFQFFLFQICKNDIDRRKNCFRVFFLKNFVFQCFWLNTQILFTIRRRGQYRGWNEEDDRVERRDGDGIRTAASGWLLNWSWKNKIEILSFAIRKRS